MQSDSIDGAYICLSTNEMLSIASYLTSNLISDISSAFILALFFVCSSLAAYFVLWLFTCPFSRVMGVL
jgi:hypothetical protein